MRKNYWTGRKEKTLEFRFGSYELKIRYFADSNKAQVTMYNIARFRFPLIWSTCLTDEQANAAAALFQSIGYFDMPESVTDYA